MRNYSIVLYFLVLFPLFIFSDITGTYEVTGFHKPTKSRYSGTAVITKTDSIYTVNWVFSDGSTDTGTGVRTHDSLSVVFLDSESNYGTQLYEIKHHILKGPWVLFGGSDEGVETLKKVHSSSNSHEH